jgi:rhodanese-related sulfurtransferase/predicted small lipoprotein YifL
MIAPKKLELFVVSLLIVLSLVFTLTGCSSKNDETTQRPAAENTAPVTEQQQTQSGVAESAQLIEATNTYLSSGKAPTISNQDVNDKIIVGKDSGYQIVEIRKPEDYAKGHVPTAINIPYGEFFNKENLAKLDKNKKIVVVCYTGHTASQITLLLNQLGYDAYAMKFGMMGWTADETVLAQKPFVKAAGYPVETTVNEAPANFNLPEVTTGKQSFEDILLAKTEQYLNSGKAPTVSAQDVYDKVVVGKDPGYVILSVRKAEDYAKGHVAGAINIPYAQVANEENLKKLPTDKKIIVICYTGHTASQITMFLNQLGYDAYAMKFGMMGWTADEKVLAQKPFVKTAGYATTPGVNP